MTSHPVKIIPLLVLTTAFWACGENKSPENNHQEAHLEAPDTTHLVETNLTDYELPFIMYNEPKLDESDLPADVQVFHIPGELDWEITYGKDFKILIEDWGDEKKTPIEEVKNQENLEQFFEYNYLEKAPDYVLYSTGIPGDTANVNYHFFSTTQTPEKVHYVITSDPIEEFSLPQAREMLKSALRLKYIATESVPNV